MNQSDWNPKLYLKYGNERLQPSLDLINRIESTNINKIIDVGCGPGNSTQVLHNRWPNSDIVGIDNSEAMLKEAKRNYPDQNWLFMDAGQENIGSGYDLIFSNAVIQWIPCHHQLLTKFKDALLPGGVIAVQLPYFWDMKIGKFIIEVAKTNCPEILTEVLELYTIKSPQEYYNYLANDFNKIDIWITNYYHIMSNHHAIIEMVRSTGLKPFLSRLKNENERQLFESMVLNKINKSYYTQDDGKVLLPFKRLFIVASKT